jgi:hypothetical protein
MIVYPFAGNFTDLRKLHPVITSEGNTVEAELSAGAGQNSFDSWEEYAALLSGDNHLHSALADAAELNQIVTVYEFTNAQADHSSAAAPTLAASFNLDYGQTAVLSYDFNGGTFDAENGFMRQCFFVPRESGQSHYLIIVGDDIENFTLQGYKNAGLNKGEEMDITADVERYEAVLGDMLRFLLNLYTGKGEPVDYDYWKFGTELFYRTSANLLDTALASEDTAQRIFFGPGTLEDLFSHTQSERRIFYLTFEIVVPAGESVTVSVDAVKPGSYDFPKGSANIGVSGYSMLAKQNSSFAFESITAVISGAEHIDIVRQNFGFQPDNGISSVLLDLETPHYFIEVR